MSWSDIAKPLALLAIATTLVGCSNVRPLYGDAGPAAGHEFHYGEPNDRLDQIVYDELRLRLGPNSTNPAAIQVSVDASASARGLTRTGVVKPVTTNEMIVNAAITVISPEGDLIFSGTRSQSATYSTRSQVLGDVEGQNEAADRAAKSLADSVRLTILSAVAHAR